MRRRFTFILMSGFWVPLAVLALYVLVEDESYFSILNWRIQEDYNFLVPLIGLFYFAYPVMIGIGGLIYLAMDWSELKAAKVNVGRLAILSGLCLISGIWLYPLLFVVALTCFPFRLPF